MTKQMMEVNYLLMEDYLDDYNVLDDIYTVAVSYTPGFEVPNRDIVRAHMKTQKGLDGIQERCWVELSGSVQKVANMMKLRMWTRRDSLLMVQLILTEKI